MSCTKQIFVMNSGERLEEHVIFLIKVIDISINSIELSTVIFRSPIKAAMPAVCNVNQAQQWDENYSIKSIIAENFDQSLKMNALEFCTALPYHVIIDEHCRLVQTGKELANHIPKELLAVGTPIMRIFEVNRPQIPFDFDNICNFINAVFVLQVRTSPTDMRNQREQSDR
ncbi:unnamed protein product [Cylicostephanus goldi]|uniref:guanylate cyclase n=1 Tax=Cylicostephanus goldi TaxID=71465 RepID=A0A3P7N7B6_CYLGO|nr:unnamed protein product [Cylicostephanus goldi]